MTRPKTEKARRRREKQKASRAVMLVSLAKGITHLRQPDLERVYARVKAALASYHEPPTEDEQPTEAEHS